MNNNNGSSDSVDTLIPYKILGYSNVKYILLSLYVSHIANSQKDNKLRLYIYYYIICTINLLQSMDSTIFVCNDWRYFYFSFNWAQLDSKEASRSAQWGCLSLCCCFPFTFIIHCRTQCVWGSYLWLADDFPQNSICDPKNYMYNCLKLKYKQSNVQIGESTKEREELNIYCIPF